MKGSNKDFARYFESELYDDVLEVPENITKLLKDEDGDKNKQKDQEDSSVITRKCPLTSDLIKDFATALGLKAQQCFNSLCQIKSIQDEEILSCFKDLYSKYETVPVLFLSVVDERKSVYVWQINRKCPILASNSQYMAVDSKSLGRVTKDHISLLLLAKITLNDYEDLKSAYLVDDRKLMIRSHLDDQNVVIRIYYVKSFLETARVNPYKEEVLANDLYSFRILLSGHDKNRLDVTSFRKKTSEEETMKNTEISNENEIEEQKATESFKKATETEITVETKTCEGFFTKFSCDSTFEILSVSEDGLLLIDYNLSLVVAWENNMIFACFSGARICKIFKKFNEYYMISSLLQVYRVDLKKFPIVSLENYQASVFPKNADYYFGSGASLLSNTCQMLMISENSAKIFFFDQGWIDILRINNLGAVPVKSIDEWYKSSSSSYYFAISSQHEILLKLSSQQLMIYKMTERGYKETFKFDLPTQNSDFSRLENEWRIIGCGTKFYFCGRSHYDLSKTTIIEFKLNVDNIQKSELNLLFKKQLKIPDGRKIFGQVEGSNENIAFIRFENEPFYFDKVNLMYNKSISLLGLIRPLKCRIQSLKKNLEGRRKKIQQKE